MIRISFLTLISGTIAALWGLPSHFGYDPSCAIIQGTVDTKCWAEYAQPTIRAFSTLGQPAWFAAYLDILLPLSMAHMIINVMKHKYPAVVTYYIITVGFYISLIFANTRAGTLAFYAVDVVFWIILFHKHIPGSKLLIKYFVILHVAFALCNFIYGFPVNILNKFTVSQIQNKTVAYAQTKSTSTITPSAPKLTGITDSGEIRKLIWSGAIEAWKANPVFGTGVETFAFAYYRYRSVEHNLTSEWEFLYNKAHNEYLNYLATTGLFGLGTYLAFLVTFLIIAAKYIYNDSAEQYHQTVQSQMSYNKTRRDFRKRFLLTSALLSSFLGILITNFFGFSVVISNLYLFVIPAFVFILNDRIKAEYDINNKGWSSNVLLQILLSCVVISIGAVLMVRLFRYWYADTIYAKRDCFHACSLPCLPAFLLARLRASLQSLISQKARYPYLQCSR